MKNIWNAICKKGTTLILTLSLVAAVFAGSGSSALAQSTAGALQATATQEDDITDEDTAVEWLQHLLGLDAAAEEGTVLDFETVDIDGNEVTNQDLFKDHKVTMVNFWATWCGHCVDEMPALEELNKELADMDCQVIGVCLDANESPDLAKQIIKEKGVTYKNVAPSDKLLEQIPVNAVPVTYFVDSEGRVLTAPVTGANFEMYSEKLAEALEKIEK